VYGGNDEDGEMGWQNSGDDNVLVLVLVFVYD
jgi:hypothetical protein